MLDRPLWCTAEQRGAFGILSDAGRASQLRDHVVHHVSIYAGLSTARNEAQSAATAEDAIDGGQVVIGVLIEVL